MSDYAKSARMQKIAGIAVICIAALGILVAFIKGAQEQQKYEIEEVNFKNEVINTVVSVVGENDPEPVKKIKKRWEEMEAAKQARGSWDLYVYLGFGAAIGGMLLIMRGNSLLRLVDDDDLE